MKFYFAFTILKEEVGRIVALVAENCCLIYENGFDEEMFNAFCKQLEFEKFNRFSFAGSKQLIDTLFQKYGATLEVSKHRIVYKCSKVSDKFSYSSGTLKIGNQRNIERLTDMGVAFSEAYDGTTISRQEAMTTIVGGIQNGNIYQWKDNGAICSIAQVMYGEYDFPVIGDFYTDPAERSKGYGASVIHQITKGLVNNGHDFSMLVADAANPASNRAFVKAGYLPTGDYIRRYKPH